MTGLVLEGFGEVGCRSAGVLSAAEGSEEVMDFFLGLAGSVLVVGVLFRDGLLGGGRADWLC